MPTLATYPYVVVRIACRHCPRVGSYRLARLAVRFGAETSMGEVLDAISADCTGLEGYPLVAGRRVCGSYFPDLSGGPPLDMPPAAGGPLRVITGGRDSAPRTQKGPGPPKRAGAKSREETPKEGNRPKPAER